MNYTVDTEVTFTVSLGYVNCDNEETFTLGELGLTEEDLEDMARRDLEAFLEQEHENWSHNTVDTGWELEGE